MSRTVCPGRAFFGSILISRRSTSAVLSSCTDSFWMLSVFVPSKIASMALQLLSVKVYALDYPLAIDDDAAEALHVEGADRVVETISDHVRPIQLVALENLLGLRLVLLGLEVSIGFKKNHGQFVRAKALLHRLDQRESFNAVVTIDAPDVENERLASQAFAADLLAVGRFEREGRTTATDDRAALPDFDAFSTTRLPSSAISATSNILSPRRSGMLADQPSAIVSWPSPFWSTEMNVLLFIKTSSPKPVFFVEYDLALGR